MTGNAENIAIEDAVWTTRPLRTTLRRFRPAGWTNDSTLWGLVRDSITRVNVNTGATRTYSARGWALSAAHDVVSWQNEAGAWMMRGDGEPQMLPRHNGLAPTNVLWSLDGTRAILAWEDEGRAHQELFDVSGPRRILQPRLTGYYGDRAVLWLDANRVLFESVASGGKDGVSGYKESGWRRDLAVLDVRSGNYARVTDAPDGVYLRVAGAHRDGVVVSEWSANGVIAHSRYETNGWTRVPLPLPRGRVFSFVSGALVIFGAGDNDSTTAVLASTVATATLDSTTAMTLGRVSRDAQPAFAPSGRIGSMQTAAGTILISRRSP